MPKRKNKKYPKINEGDMVRVNIKTIFCKYHAPSWSSTRHTVVRIKGNQYLSPRINKDTLHLRCELLKVHVYLYCY